MRTTLKAPLRILVVEDNEVYRSSLELLLGLAGGFAVVGSVADGGAAVEAYPRIAPDAVVLDLRLPGISGAETAAALVALDPGAAIVCISAGPEPDDVAHAKAAGAHDVIDKGAPVDVLVAALAAATSERATR